jgi:hypothetical protein
VSPAPAAAAEVGRILLMHLQLTTRSPLRWPLWWDVTDTGHPSLQVAAPTNTVQQIREARLQPLKVALQDAIALHTKATGVREALEAEVGSVVN